MEADAVVHFSDEMRLGLRGHTRRVLARRGVKPVQRLQLRYQWSYLLLAVDPLAGSLQWRWLERMNKDQLLPALRGWGLEALVWDGAPAHRAKVMHELPTHRVLLPPYSPELNPAERVFEELRRKVEGRVYEGLEAQRKVADDYLEGLSQHPDRVKSLCGWEWIRQALQSSLDYS